MDKQKVKLGSLVTIGSILLIALLVLLIVKLPTFQEMIFTFLGPLSVMALFVGMFILFSGLFHKEERNS